MNTINRRRQTKKIIQLRLYKGSKMASEESRRVADYFVVCGLPKDNPQPLDDTSLEVSLRSTAHQDPITDITVRLHLNQSEIMYKGLLETNY